MRKNIRVEMNDDKCITCVAIGDGYVGKTTLLARLANREIDWEYAPTIFDNCSTDIEVDNKKYSLHLIDTAGQEGFEHIRKQFYGNADLFLVCFSVTDMTSFSNVKQRWIPELQSNAPNIPILIVGTKSDLRNDPETIDRMNMSGEIFVSKLVATNFAKSYNTRFVECSATTKVNISEVLNSIVSTVAKHRIVTKSNWCSWWFKYPLTTIIRRAFCCRHYSDTPYVV